MTGLLAILAVTAYAAKWTVDDYRECKRLHDEWGVDDFFPHVHVVCHTVLLMILSAYISKLLS